MTVGAGMPTSLPPGAADGATTLATSDGAPSGLALRRQGWFYRVVAPDPDAPVLELGSNWAREWFANVVDGNAVDIDDQPESVFGLVILHRTLGGRASMRDALRSAHRRLVGGGVVALAGGNRLASSFARAGAPQPSAFPSGYRRAAREAGFARSTVFFARPDLDAPVYVVATERASSRAFYRADVAARKASERLRRPWLRIALNAFDLTSFEPCLIMVARKC